jgi:hypothetical protein
MRGTGKEDADGRVQKAGRILESITTRVTVVCGSVSALINGWPKPNGER